MDLVVSTTAKLRGEYSSIPRVSFLTPEEREHARAGGVILFRSHVPSARGGYWRQAVVRADRFGPRVPTVDMVAEAERIMALPEKKRPMPAPLPEAPPRPKAPRLPKLPMDVREAVSRGVVRSAAYNDAVQRRLGTQAGLEAAIDMVRATAATLGLKKQSAGNSTYRQGIQDALHELEVLLRHLKGRLMRVITEAEPLQARLTGRAGHVR